jgi:hypothetical protein
MTIAPPTPMSPAKNDRANATTIRRPSCPSVRAARNSSNSHAATSDIHGWASTRIPRPSPMVDAPAGLDRSAVTDRSIIGR